RTEHRHRRRRFRRLALSLRLRVDPGGRSAGVLRGGSARLVAAARSRVPVAPRLGAARLRTARAEAAAALSGAPGSPGRRSRWVVGRRALDVRRPLASLLLDGPVVGPSSPPVARPATDGRRLSSRAPGLAAAGGTPGPQRSGALRPRQT